MAVLPKTQFNSYILYCRCLSQVINDAGELQSLSLFYYIHFRFILRRGHICKPIRFTVMWS